MAKNVITIPATKSRYTAAPLSSKKKRRVAAYARVSTDHEDQQSSYEAQVDYYTRYIKSCDDWEFVSIYTDEGISATNTKKREGFKTMIADALAGKIDLIVTKSVSRFARNTVDSLTTVRKLKDEGIEIYFEKENIWLFWRLPVYTPRWNQPTSPPTRRLTGRNGTWENRLFTTSGNLGAPPGMSGAFKIGAPSGMPAVRKSWMAGFPF